MISALVAGGFIVFLGLVLAYELGDHGAWARSRRASRNLADVEERRAQRALYPTTQRSVLGTPRQWSDAA